MMGKLHDSDLDAAQCRRELAAARARVDAALRMKARADQARQESWRELDDILSVVARQHQRATMDAKTIVLLKITVAAGLVLLGLAAIGAWWPR